MLVCALQFVIRMLHHRGLASAFVTLCFTGCYLSTDDDGGLAEADPAPCVSGCEEDLDADGYAAPLDCNDLDAAVHPGVHDGCSCIGDGLCCEGDGVDDDCNGQVDELCDDCQRDDLDADGYFDGEDCDDTDATVHPGADDCCVDDDVDQDCDGLVDGNRIDPCRCERLVDADFDGYAEGADCNDQDRDINPGRDEVCCDGIDNDCDDVTNDCCVGE